MNNMTEEKITPLGGLYSKLFDFIPDIQNAARAPIVYAEDLTTEVFQHKWVDNNRPCLIKKAVQHWPAVGKWRSKDYWLSTCDNFGVTVFPHENHVDYSRIKGEDMPFYDAIERLFQNRDPVFSIPARKISGEKQVARLLDDIKGFHFLPSAPMPRDYDRQRLFIYRRAATAWHYHAIDETLMCQVNGAKRVALLPPDIPHPKNVIHYLRQERYLDGKPLDPSLKLKPMIADVEEGDALYIPPYWHHGVAPKDGEIGFTLAYCWASPWHKLGDFSNYFVRNLYKDAMWPLRKISPFVPFLGLYAGFLHLKRTLLHQEPTAG
ncbi:MAG TPA: cupin-like domain-containing protein [Puia sp.]|nr:cupin-like domain-containing protein [Puia sp.]